MRLLFRYICHIILYIFILLVNISCSKQELNEEIQSSEVYKEACLLYEEYAEKYHPDESFLFFTDPHLPNIDGLFPDSSRESFISSFDLAKALYDDLSLYFCLCGGDWLNRMDTQDIAKQKLLFVDEQMKSLFNRYYKILGNHDTNYQGVISNNNSGRGDLPRSFIDQVYFVETGSAFYSFVGNMTRFYVLDSGLDWTSDMDDYRWEQIHWLANQLGNNRLKHIAICIHMFYIDERIVPMSKELVQLIDAFNNRSSITLQGIEYDFSLATGNIQFVLSGHNHKDSITFVGENGTIPIIQTINYSYEGSNSFDLCQVDYNCDVLTLIRVGYGESRSVSISPSCDF